MDVKIELTRRTTIMSAVRIKKAANELRRLKKLGPKKFFKTCNKQSILKICECVKNVLNGNLHIKPCHLKKLSRHKQTLRQLALKKTSLKVRKRLLQKRGFLGLLLPALAPLVGGLLENIFGNDSR